MIIRPSALGDVCRSVPVLTALRRAAPDAAIHWLVQDTFAEAIEAHPDLDGVIRFPRNRLRRLATRPDRWAEAVRFFGSLRGGRFDLVIDCQGLARSGLMSACTGAAVRIVDRAAREGGWLGGNRRVSIAPDIHEVDRMLALARAAGAEGDGDATLHVSPAGRAAWARRRSVLALPGGFIVLAPATRWLSKAWPAGCWSSLGRQLLDRDAALKLVLVGSPTERQVCAAVLEGLQSHAQRVIDVSGETSVGELMAIIEEATLTIASDSAPVHMAVGLGGRYLGLYGPTDAALVGPWHGMDKVIQAPRRPGEQFDYRSATLGDSVMRRIEVDDVVDAALDALGMGS